jgi:hypothetical protein
MNIACWGGTEVIQLIDHSNIIGGCKTEQGRGDRSSLALWIFHNTIYRFA